MKSITSKAHKKSIVHEKLQHKKVYHLFKKYRKIWLFLFGISTGICLLITFGIVIGYLYENQFAGKIYPGVMLAKNPVGGLTSAEVTQLWLSHNARFTNNTFTLKFENHTATLSANTLDIGFDATTAATQTYLIGRSGNFLADWYNKYQALQSGINVTPTLTWKKDVFKETVDTLAQNIDIPAQNALFEFSQGRVSAFKPAMTGRKLDQDDIRRRFEEQLFRISVSPIESNIIFNLSVIPQEPSIKTTAVNTYGIKELIGSGESFYKGSIAGRIHNVALAASRLNGVLIKPGEIFSFNDAVGDISAATGYKQAYVIKSGRTVLDDGGGVCQVSTTLFRAALHAGLPILERHAHSYRVGYYEQGGIKPGFDATVYAPSYDLKIKNDYDNYILIQAKTDTTNTHLEFELYGTKDGRLSEISQVTLSDPKPAPPDLYQDDPTLPTGQIKQVDWANTGIKANFNYKVIKNGQILFEKTFYSNFVPWQAVYLRGTAPQ